MTTSVTNGRRVTSGEKQRIRDLAGRRKDAGPEHLRFARLLDQAELDAEPAEPLQGQHLVAVRRGRHGLADEDEQLGVVAVHQRRDVAEAVVDHVRLGRELRVRTVADELRHRKAAVGDVLVKGAVRQRPLGRDEVHVRLAPQPVAQMAQLRDLVARDGQLALGRRGRSGWRA